MNSRTRALEYSRMQECCDADLGRDFWFFLSSWVLECLSSCLLKLFSSKGSFHFAGTIRKKLVQMHKTCWCVSEIRAGSDRKRAEHPEGERSQRPEHER